MLPGLGWHLKKGTPREQRLAAGAGMAITINKEGKMDSTDCLGPLADLLLDMDTDEVISAPEPH